MPAKVLGKNVWVMARPGNKIRTGVRHHSQLRQSAPSVMATSAAAPAALSQEVDRCYNKLDLSFENGKEAFKVRFLSAYCYCLFRVNPIGS